ncbi:MAG: energy-coupling factor ABC transporter permease [Thermoplasmata archaeon]
MHIPDGLMNPILVGIGWIVAIVFIGTAIRLANRRLEDRQIPVMGVLAAAVFVAQMLNFPVLGGTSGHLVGAALLAIILGPWTAIIVMLTILLIQGLVFGDGGLTALGLNTLNMAICGSFIGWFTFRGIGGWNREFAVFAASWLSVLAGASLCAAELSLSFSISGGAYGIIWSIAIPAMLGYHALIGIGEGIIATGTYVFISRVSPEILRMPKLTLFQREEVSAQ